MVAKKRAAKKPTKKRSRAKRNESTLAKMSTKDRARVRRDADHPFTLPITKIVLSHNKPKATERAIRDFAGHPGAFTTKPGGDIRVSTKNPSFKRSQRPAKRK